MKSLMIIPFIIFSFIAEQAEAASLKSTADRLGQEVTQIGFSIALFGLALGAIYLILGKQDAANKITLCLLGVLCLACSPALLKFIQSLA